MYVCIYYDPTVHGSRNTVLVVGLLLLILGFEISKEFEIEMNLEIQK